MDNKIEVKLVGENGNIFNLMAICTKELKKAGQHDKAEQLVRELITSANSYTEALAVISKYVEVI